MDVEPAALTQPLPADHHLAGIHSARAHGDQSVLIAAEVDIRIPGRQIARELASCRIRQIKPATACTSFKLCGRRSPTRRSQLPRRLRRITGGVLGGAGGTCLKAYVEAALSVRLRLTGFRWSVGESYQVPQLCPASEWLCQFSRSTASGHIASPPNAALDPRTQGSPPGAVVWVSSQWFVRSIPIGSGIPENRFILPEGDMAITVNVHDADGAPSASLDPQCQSTPMAAARRGGTSAAKFLPRCSLRTIGVHAACRTRRGAVGLLRQASPHVGQNRTVWRNRVDTAGDEASLSASQRPHQHFNALPGAGPCDAWALKSGGDSHRRMRVAGPQAHWDGSACQRQAVIRATTPGEDLNKR